LNLPHPEAVFDIDFFKQNPLPFYTLAHELYPGRFRPTISHCFITLLHRHNLLHRCYTQNIDTLERIANVPGDKIIEAHGSFAMQRCIDCKEPFPDDEMRQHVNNKEIPHCKAPECNGLVKPDIVFFGEPLPQTFHQNAVTDTTNADLGIVMGTSLSVAPFAYLPQMINEGVPRLMINMQKVGELGSRRDDVLILGDCDGGVRKLCKELGWLEELEQLWAETAPEQSKEEKEQAERVKNTPRHELLEEEVEKITRDVEKSLNIAQDHKRWVEEQLAKEKVVLPSSSTPNSQDKDIAVDTNTLVSTKSAGSASHTPSSTPSSPNSNRYALRPRPPKQLNLHKADKITSSTLAKSAQDDRSASISTTQDASSSITTDDVDNTSIDNLVSKLDNLKTTDSATVNPSTTDVETK